MAQPVATIIVPTYNEARHLPACIQSVLRQTVPDWELIIVDDGSTDNTEEVVAQFKDPRISYLRNAINLGEPASRNRGIAGARADFIFFVDADCVASDDWLQTGLHVFATRGPAGVEGKLIFVAPDYKPAYADRVVENLTGGLFMTANMAYRKSALVEAGLFNPTLRRYCDRDIALKVKRCGSIVFAPQMVVTHALSRWKPRAYFRSAQGIQYTVLMFKDNRGADQAAHRIFHRVYHPKALLAVLFPPLVLTELFAEPCRTPDDYKVLALVYPRMVYERLLLWRSSVRERTFLI